MSLYPFQLFIRQSRRPKHRQHLESSDDALICESGQIKLGDVVSPGLLVIGSNFLLNLSLKSSLDMWVYYIKMCFFSIHTDVSAFSALMFVLYDHSA